MGLQEFPSKPVNKGGVIVGTPNGPVEIAVSTNDTYLAADSSTTSGTRWKPFFQYNTVQLTSGTSWTVPAAVTAIDVIVIGAGQGGNGCSTGATANANRTANGGAPGAFSYQPNYPVTPGASIAYSIGAGGAGGVGSGVNTTTHGTAGGNTTFGAIVSPGGQNKIGARFPYARTDANNRGIYDFRNSGTSFDGLAYSASLFAGAAGFPDGPGAEVHGSVATGATSSTGWSSPYVGTSDTTSFSWWDRYSGFTGTYNKLLSAFTAPQGAASNIVEQTAGGQRLAGWAGFGANGNATAGTTYAMMPGWHGGGGAGSINTSVTGTTRAAAGGAAGTNSGAGGGGSAVTTGSTIAALVNGGAGGSGVIFIGYWA